MLIRCLYDEIDEKWLFFVAICRLFARPLNDPGTSPLPVLSPQSLIFLGCVAAAGLGLNLLGLAVYLSCLCCCRKEEEEEEESKKPGSCCVTWAAVAAALLTW